jgi:hypothetical protein
MSGTTDSSLSPLEQFVREYVESRDGAWDEIEPRVYDLLIGPDILQLSFDPEALPEHPRAQMASLGSPLVDRLLADAAERWSACRLYRFGLNLRPHSLPSRLARAISLPPGVAMSIDGVRVMNCPQAVFWFKATFSGDQKEEEILPIGIDLHYQRQVRHLDLLLAPDRLSETPEAHLAEAPHAGLMAGYRAACRQVAPTVAALANTRRREWTARMDKQIARMTAYYAQLRREAESPAGRPADPALAAARALGRRQAIDHEEQLRFAELRQKSAVRTRIRLISLMLVLQPKLLISLAIAQKNHPAGEIAAVWDPLCEAVEALACPSCGHPTFAPRIHRKGLGCESCAGDRNPR